MKDLILAYRPAIQAVLSINISNKQSQAAAMADIEFLINKTVEKPIFKPMYLPALVYQATFCVASQFHNAPDDYIRSSFKFQPKRSIAGLFEITSFLIPFMEHLTEKQHVQLLRVHFTPTFITLLRRRLQFITDAPDYIVLKLNEFRKALVRTSLAFGVTRLFNQRAENKLHR